jgi:hypothetical protein
MNGSPADVKRTQERPAMAPDAFSRVIAENAECVKDEGNRLSLVSAPFRVRCIEDFAQETVVRIFDSAPRLRANKLYSLRFAEFL